MRALRWLMLGAAACGGSAPRVGGVGDTPAEEPPVALNAEPMVQYPPTLYDQGVEGDVELRLFVDSTGRLAPESTRVTESSRNAALDSAAVRGVARLRYAPGRRHGLPVATSFLQTIEFRHPEVAGAVPAAARPDSTRPRRDSTHTLPRARADSARVRPDTTRPPASPSVPAPAPDTTKSKPDSSGATP
jgi:TonB family protein